MTIKKDYPELMPHLDTISLKRTTSVLDEIYYYGIEPIIRAVKTFVRNDFDQEEAMIAAFHIQEHAKAVGRCIYRLMEKEHAKTTKEAS